MAARYHHQLGIGPGTYCRGEAGLGKTDVVANAGDD
jgi:hypothetical protein